MSVDSMDAVVPAGPGVRSVVSPPVRVAVVGCGAMTRENLMPVLCGYERIRLVALVDVNEANARALADSYGVPAVLTSLDALTKDLVDAVIIATPPAFHAPQAIELARRGLHLFVEKPMVLDAAEGERMLAAAAAAGVTLSVGLYRRLLPSTRLLRGLVESGIVGRPVAVDIEEGGEYGWPLASLGNLTRKFGGGGVVMDIGSHVLDQLNFILPGETRLVRYVDNARGGVETDAVIELRKPFAGGEIPCRIELSRTRELRNSIRIECERGTLELPRGEFAAVRVRVAGVDVTDAVAGARPVSVSATWGDEAAPIGYQVFRTEVDDWVNAMMTGGQPILSGESVMPTVRLIEACYNSVSPLPEPWTEEGLRPATPRTPTGPTPLPTRVLVTGASGFIGCRTVELLSSLGVAVRAMVHDPGHAARLARLPVEMVVADINVPTDLDRVIAGCDAVVHCAVGTSWQRHEVVKVTVDGTRNLVDAAVRAGVTRFVHISSMAVHGQVGTPVFDETAPLISTTADYYDGDKRRAEDEVQKGVTRGLPAVILRPARVYGPFSRTFITRPLQFLGRSQLVLAGAVDAPASMVYVDNVVGAIIRALECDPSVVGEAFLISDPDQLSWRDFYEYFAAGSGATLRIDREFAPSQTDERAPGLVRRWGTGLKEVVMSPEFRGLAKKCVQTDPIGVWPRRLWEDVPTFRRRVQRMLRIDDAVVYRPAPVAAPSPLLFWTEAPAVNIDKARRRLGYEPLVGQARAMELTRQWAQYARLIAK